MSPTQPAFDELIHAPIRLRICVMLSPVESANFQTLRDDLDVADSVLSKHLKALSDAGYVTIKKQTGTGRRPVTWAKLTGLGRKALNAHLAALHELSAQAAQPPGSAT